MTMWGKSLVLLFMLAGSSAAATAAAPFETMFAGFPENTSQHGLRELAPVAFARAGLTRETGCMAAALYFEARGESREGRIAVAQVIANRVRARAYPDTICGVVWQNSHRRNACQFSFTCDGVADRPRGRMWRTVIREAKAFLCDPCAPKRLHPRRRLDRKTRGATHYHATYVRPRWARRLERTGKIGRHIFYVSARVRRTMPTG